MTRALLIVFVIGFFAAVYTAMVFVAAIEPPKHYSNLTPADFGKKFQNLTMVTQDGLALAGWLVPCPKTKAAVIIGHGYPYDKGSRLSSTIFLSQKYNLVYFDFRSFGQSEGRVTTFGIREKQDVDDVLRYINQHYHFEPIGMLGYSFSAAVFIQAHPQMVKAMVLDSPFMSMQAMSEQAYRWLPGPAKWPFIQLSKWYCRWFLNVDFDEASALAAVGQVHTPVLFIHGQKDKQVPLQQSEKLYAACGSNNKQLWVMPNAGHQDRNQQTQQVYEEKITAFFDQWLK